jgi:hypothetical protein
MRFKQQNRAACRISLATLVLAGAAASTPAAAQDVARPTVTLGRATGPIRLDGVLDEPDWQAAGLIPDLTQQAPIPGGETPYRTEVRLLTDGAVIYIGVHCGDPDPGRIATHTMLRDADLASDDAVGFVFDTFGDRRTGYAFLINAAGARFDGLIVSPENVPADWDGIWDARVGRDASGWSLEVAIPAATLRFATGLPAWGFNVVRTVPRDRTEMRWTGATLDARFPDMRRAGDLAGVDVLGQGLGLTITPYGLVRHNTDFGGGGSETDGDAGVDIGWAMTRQLSGVLTVNTDFAETEADTRQINLTRFPLFYPEKRYFFVEGSNQFEFGPNLGTDFVAFFSRRVGLFEGELVPIDVGTKVIGRQGPWGIGALAVRTGDSDAAPATSLAAARVTRDIGGHLRLGMVGTSGDPSGTRENWLGGLDAVWTTSSLKGDQNLTAGGWWARTGGDPPPAAGSDESIPGAGEDGRADAWGVLVDYPNDRWDNAFSFKSLGERFNPALGFLPRTGIRLSRGHVAFQPRPQSAPWSDRVRQFYFELAANLTTDQAGRVESWDGTAIPFAFDTPTGAHLETGWLPQFERLDAPFEVSEGVVVPPGVYHFQRWHLQADSRPDRTIRFGAGYGSGGFYDGHLGQWSGYVRWSSRTGRLQLDAETLYVDGRLPEGDFIEQLWQQKAIFAFSPDLVLSLYTQYDSVSRNLGADARLRYTIHPGADLYVVWNHGWIHPPGAPTGTELEAVDDQAVVKLRWAWRPAAPGARPTGGI